MAFLSIKGMMVKMMIDNGLFEEDAESVISRVMEADDQKLMAVRWLDNKDDYPSFLGDVIYKMVHREVLSWMDEFYPKHWARPMFEDTTN